MDSVWVPTPAARPCDSVIAALAHCHASFTWEVAQQTGEEQRNHRHDAPADAALGLRAREGLVGAGVLVVAGAVVEERLDAAHARPVLHHVLRRAHAPPAARPAGGEHPPATALWTLAAPAVLAFVGVLVLGLRGPAARHGHHRPALVVQGFQLL